MLLVAGNDGIHLLLGAGERIGNADDKITFCGNILLYIGGSLLHGNFVFFDFVLNHGGIGRTDEHHAQT